VPEKWKKGEKNSRFVALLRPWKEEVKTREKSGLVFLRLKTKAFLFFLLHYDLLRQHTHANSSIGHSFATQYFTISRLP
jgi:hypothetical protein